MKPRAARRVRCSAWLGRWVSMSVFRRPQPPALYEVYGNSALAVARERAKLVEAVNTLGDTVNCIAILCGGGVATVVDASNPVGRVVCVVEGVRPRLGKAGLSAEFQKFIEQAELHEKRLGVRIVKKLTKLIRRGFEWCHGVLKRPNDPSSATRPPGGAS